MALWYKVLHILVTEIWDSETCIKYHGERCCRKEDTGTALEVVSGDNCNYMNEEAVVVEGRCLYVPILEDVDRRELRLAEVEGEGHRMRRDWDHNSVREVYIAVAAETGIFWNWQENEMAA